MRDEHDEHEALDADLRAAYRAPHPGEPDARARVLARVARPRASGASWWLAPQLFVLRPAAALAVGVITLSLATWGGMRLATMAAHERELARAPLPAHGVPVTFVLRAPGATSVCVAGDFNSWDAAATPLTHTGSGDLWIANVELPRGVHLYSFVLDGREWRPDPSAPLAADDAFGGRNSVIVVNGAQPL